MNRKQKRKMVTKKNVVHTKVNEKSSTSYLCVASDHQESINHYRLINIMCLGQVDAKLNSQSPVTAVLLFCIFVRVN